MRISIEDLITFEELFFEVDYTIGGSVTPMIYGGTMEAAQEGSDERFISGFTCEPEATERQRDAIQEALEGPYWGDVCNN